MAISQVLTHLTHLIYNMEKITFEEHKQFGKLCKLFNDKLVHELTRIMNESNSRREGEIRTKHYVKAIKSLGRLRDSIEEIMYKDYPKNLISGIYYGRIEEKK